MQLKNLFEIRSSASSQIMTEPRSGKGLSKTCLTYVHKWLKEQPEFYGNIHSFSNKYTEKGNFCEPESIQYASKIFKWGEIEKNVEWKSNGFINGTADVILPSEVSDIKNSWSDETFPLFEKEIPEDAYFSQLMCYCCLYEKPKASLIYTLMDAPEYMIEKEARKKAFALGLDDIELDLFNEVKKSMTFSHLSDNLRVKRYDVFYDKEYIQKVIQRVIEIRSYISNLSELDFLQTNNEFIL